MSAIDAFVLFAHGIGCHYFEDAPLDLFCTKCRVKLSADPYLPKKLRRLKRMRHFGCTYDNVLLLSRQAVEFLVELETPGLRFEQVNHDPDYFNPVTDQIAKLDVHASKPNYTELCATCHRYSDVTLPFPIILKDADAISPSGFYRSDVWFSNNQHQVPLTIVGGSLKRKIDERFGRDVHFRQIGV